MAVKLLSKLEKNVAVIAIFYTDHSYTPLGSVKKSYQTGKRVFKRNKIYQT